jgi:hypothetical protein
MFASHTLANEDNDGEYRVLVIGDSATWGILLEPGETLAGQINTNRYQTPDGRSVQAYNLGYPTMSLTKDLMLLDYAMRYDPDLIVWLFTLQSFDPATQLDSAIVRNNATRVRNLIRKYAINQRTDDARFVKHSFWNRTIIGQRRALADLLRLQLYSIPWALTGIDQEYRDDFVPRAEPTDDNTWQGYRPRTFEVDELAFDVLRAGVELAQETPILLINEPIFISTSQHSDVRYNLFYPRWAYDNYRQLLEEQSAENAWKMLDLWDALPMIDCYTDSPVHLTPTCSAQLGEIVGDAILQIVATGSLCSEVTDLNFAQIKPQIVPCQERG